MVRKRLPDESDKPFDLFFPERVDDVFDKATELDLSVSFACLHLAQKFIRIGNLIR